MGSIAVLAPGYRGSGNIRMNAGNIRGEGKIWYSGAIAGLYIAIKEIRFECRYILYP